MTVSRFALYLRRRRVLKRDEGRNPLVVALRTAAYPLVLVFVRFGISPNAVTLSAVVGAIAAAWCLYQKNTAEFLVFGLLATTLDYADGSVARLSGRTSRFGYLFDYLGDRFKFVIILLSWAAAEQHRVVSILAALIVSQIAALDILSHTLVPMSERPRIGNTKSARAKAVLRFDMHSFVIFIVAISLGPVPGRLAGGALYVVVIIETIAQLRRRVQLRPLFICQLNPKLRRLVSSVPPTA